MNGALQRAWGQRGPLACALWPLSLLYGALAALRRALYRCGWRAAERMPVPVVVVGNVVAGGAGKTPVTLALAQHLRARGLRPGIVSRGYGRRGTDCREVLPGSAAADTGDEPLLLRRASGVPVFVAPRRAQAARALLTAHPAVNVILCDDGLQHHALARDIELCVFDERGTGNGWLLPAGPLREPWPRRAVANAPCPAPASFVLHSGTPPTAASFPIERALAPVARHADGSGLPLASLRGQPLHALAGIARPAAFFDMLRAAGLTLAHTQALPDHYDFDSSKPIPDNGLRLICTEKDAVKLWPHRPDALAVPLHATLTPAFLAAFDAALHAAARLSSPDGFQAA